MEIKILPPILPDSMDQIVEDADYLLDKQDQEEEIRDVMIKNVLMENTDLSGMRFSAVKFVGCTFLDCSFVKGEFIDVIFISCNFSNCNFSSSYFDRVEMSTSKGLGTKFSGSTIRHTLIRECNLNYSNFDGSKLEFFCIKDSEMRESYLTQCRIKNMKISGVQLEKASFFKTALKGLDFRDSSIQGIMVSDDYKELKGAMVDLYQAAELAKYLGLIIKE